MTHLQGEAREEALKGLTGWTFQEDKDAIFKQFVFKDFKQAWGFMSKVALAAEQVCDFIIVYSWGRCL